MSLLEQLRQPDREFTAMPFWFLNGDLQEAEIERQLADFVEHGIYGVVLHPRIGLPDRISYLSEVFFHYIEVAVACCARLDMKVVLYDEGMYPSGSAGGLVVAGHPEYSSKGIALVEEVLQEDVILAEVGTQFLVERKSGGTIRGTHYGEDDGEAYAPKSADILDQGAVDRFIQLTHEQYYAHMQPFFGNTIIAFFTDEPSILGRNVNDMYPWTSGFASEFVQAGGVLAELADLFDRKENDSTRLYHQMILEKESNVYYRSLSVWCESHGISLMGHPHQSDDIEVEKWFHIPGQDLVFRWVGPETTDIAGVDSVMGHCGSDAAWLYGRRRNANECFGACNREDNPWYFTADDMKWFIDYLAVRGVNLFVPHAFYYSIEGKRSGERPPDVGPNSIWWTHYKQIARYMQRLSYLMTDAVSYDKVAICCHNRSLYPEKVAELFKHQIGFRYVPKSFLAEANHQGQIEEGFAIIVAEDEKIPETVYGFAAVTCEPAQPDLRVAHFDKEGTECFYLVNAGESDIECRVSFHSEQKGSLENTKNWIAYDLWNDRIYRMSDQLRLLRRASLLIFEASREEWEKAKEWKEENCLFLSADFQLSKEDVECIQKEYVAYIEYEDQDGHCMEEQEQLFLAVEADEMAELFINGKAAGVSFFSPHQFELTDRLADGKNEMRLVVTGSLANRYGEPVFYGIKVTDQK